MILLDTNVLSELMKSVPDRRVVQWMDAFPASEFFISAVSVAEISLGIALLPKGRRKSDLAKAAGLMFAEFSTPCLPFDENAALRYAALVAGQTQTGRPISVEDAQIAAIAIIHGLKLATRNTRDFEKQLA